MGGKRGPSLSAEQREQIRAEAMVLPISVVAANHDLTADHVHMIVARGPHLFLDVRYVSARKQRAAILALDTLENMFGALNAVSAQIQNRDWLMQRSAGDVCQLVTTLSSFAGNLYTALEPSELTVEPEDSPR